MKVLFAVNNDDISNAIVKKYQKEYKEILSYKNVYYFNAILKELQKDKTYDRLVISEDLEPFANNNYDAIDKFLFDKLDNISDEAINENGKDTEIIIICTDRRNISDDMLIKLFGIGIYNAIVGHDRSIGEVCKLIHKPRTKKEAKFYYKIESENVNYQTENENSVSETEVKNIIAHYNRLGKNEEKYVESFNNIVSQYNDSQLKIIIKYLPIGVKAVLEEKSPKYQQLTAFQPKNALKDTKNSNEKKIVVSMLDKESEKKNMKKPIVIPSAMNKQKVKRLIEQKTEKKTRETSNIQENEEDDLLDSLNNSVNNLDKIINNNSKQTEEYNLNDLENVDDIDEDIDIIDTENIENDTDETTEIQQQEIKPKRGRGRPRKIIPETEQQTENKPKRGRGRPRKNVEPVISVNNKPEEDVDLFNVNNNQEDEDVDLFNLNDEQEDEENDENVDLFNLDDEQEDEENDEDVDLFNLDDEQEDEENDEDVDLFNLNDEQEDEENDEDVDLFNLDDEQEDEENDEDVDLFNLNDEQEDEENDEDVDLFNLNNEKEDKDIEEDDDDDFFNLADNYNEEKNDNKSNIKNSVQVNEQKNHDNIIKPTPISSSLNSNKKEITQTSFIPQSDDYRSLLTKDKKVVSFVGTTKNGTSFVVNNVAQVLSSRNIKTAILDLTKTRNAYYIYTNSDERLMEKARTCIYNLKNGVAEGIEINKNLSVYTSIPDEDSDFGRVDEILETLIKNYSVVLIDCDFDTPMEYFDRSQETYLVQSMDVLTMQPLTAFLRNLQSKDILKPEKLRVIINKRVNIKSVSIKTLIGGISKYNDPSMTYMKDLFDKDNINYCVIPFEMQNYIKYLDAVITCSVTLNGYTKPLISALNELGNMIYPVISNKTYSPRGDSYKDSFSNEMNNTLNRMKKYQ